MTKKIGLGLIVGGIVWKLILFTPVDEFLLAGVGLKGYGGGLSVLMIIVGIIFIINYMEKK